ncbi:thioesterase family protein [Bradyrhizobium sp. 14AA]
MSAQELAEVITTRRIVNWGECDFAGIAYTPRFADWSVEAIEQAYSSLGVPWRELHEKHGLGSPFVRMSLEFKSPLHLDDELQQRVTVAKVGRSSIEWSVVGKVADRVIYEATLVNVIVDKQTGASSPLPSVLREKLGAISDDPKRKGVSHDQ